MSDVRRRAFLCDPVCAQPIGHNVVGLKYFRDHARGRFDPVVAIASRALDAGLAKNYGFERGFDFYYGDYIELGCAEAEPDRTIAAGSPSRDAYEGSALSDYQRLVDQHSIGPCDTLVLPCVDYYGALGAIRLLEMLGPARAPRLRLRFIGVMEFAARRGLPGRKWLLEGLRSVLRKPFDVGVCAETPRYADHLAEELDTFVDVVPYPVHTTSAAGRDDELDAQPFTVICPGSARLDKGYLLLADIASAVMRRLPVGSVRLMTQALPSVEALQHWRYTNKLYAVPGVELLPERISEAQMNALYERADLIALPYDRATYEYRGSAVFMEALSRGIPVVALDGPAFAEQVTYYGAGTIVPDSDAFADAIVAAAHERARGVRPAALMRQARARFENDTAGSFERWWR